MNKIAWLCIVIISCTFCSSIPEPVQDPEPLALKVMTYNIHHAAGMDGVIDISRIADVIVSADPDLVSLQEVDRFVERTARADQARQLEELTGMYMAFGFAINYQGGDFGNVILSKYPLTNITMHPLPGDPGEDRTLMEATIALPGYSTPITFLATHLDTFTKPRTESIPLILDVLPATNDHLYILAGDLNDGPGTPVMDSLAQRFTNAAPAHLFTFPSSNPDRQIDHILFTATEGWSVILAEVIDEPVASDHAPLVAVFEFDQ